MEALQMTRLDLDDKYNRHPPRSAVAHMMRQAGETYEAIGKHLGVSAERARQIEFKGEEAVKRWSHVGCQDLPKLAALLEEAVTISRGYEMTEVTRIIHQVKIAAALRSSSQEGHS